MVARKPEEIVEMDVVQLESLIARIEQGTLEREDLQTLRAVLESYFYVTQLIDKKSTTIARLRQLVFGATTEKTADVTGRDERDARAGGQSGATVRRKIRRRNRRNHLPAIGSARRRKVMGATGPTTIPAPSA